MTTIPDIQLSPSIYTNLFSASSIPEGTEVIIQNKGPNIIVVQNTPSKPDDSSWHGFLIPQMSVWIAPQGTLGLWAKGDSTVAVEVR